MKVAVNAALTPHLETADKRQIAIEVTHPREPLELYCDDSHVHPGQRNALKGCLNRRKG